LPKNPHFSFRIRPDQKAFINFLADKGINVSGFLREKLDELRKQFPEWIKKQIEELQEIYAEYQKNNHDYMGVPIEDDLLRQTYIVLCEITTKRKRKNPDLYEKEGVGLETTVKDYLPKKLKIKESTARGLLKKLANAGYIIVKDKRIWVKFLKEGGENE